MKEFIMAVLEKHKVSLEQGHTYIPWETYKETPKIVDDLAAVIKYRCLGVKEEEITYRSDFNFNDEYSTAENIKVYFMIKWKLQSHEILDCKIKDGVFTASVELEAILKNIDI